MAHNYIILWNCGGIRSNREDIEWLISKYAPAAICWQETMLKPEHNQHLNIIQIIIKVIFKYMVVFVFLSKTTSSIVKVIFKLIWRLWLFVLTSIIRHIL